MKHRSMVVQPVLVALACVVALALGSVVGEACTPKAIDCRAEFTPAPTPEGGCAARDAGAD